MKTEEQETVRSTLRDTIIVLCRNGLTYKRNIKIQGLLAITADDKELFVVHLNDEVDQDYWREPESSAPSLATLKLLKRPRQVTSNTPSGGVLSLSKKPHNVESSTPSGANLSLSQKPRHTESNTPSGSALSLSQKLRPSIEEVACNSILVQAGDHAPALNLSLNSPGIFDGQDILARLDGTSSELSKEINEIIAPLTSPTVRVKREQDQDKNMDVLEENVLDARPVLGQVNLTASMLVPRIYQQLLGISADIGNTAGATISHSDAQSSTTPSVQLSRACAIGSQCASGSSRRASGNSSRRASGNSSRRASGTSSRRSSSSDDDKTSATSYNSVSGGCGNSSVVIDQPAGASVDPGTMPNVPGGEEAGIPLQNDRHESSSIPLTDNNGESSVVCNENDETPSTDGPLPLVESKSNNCGRSVNEGEGPEVVDIRDDEEEEEEEDEDEAEPQSAAMECIDSLVLRSLASHYAAGGGTGADFGQISSLVDPTERARVFDNICNTLWGQTNAQGNHSSIHVTSSSPSGISLASPGWDASGQYFPEQKFQPSNGGLMRPLYSRMPRRPRESIEKRFTCPFCKLSYYHKKHLTYHLKKKHGF